MYYVAKYVVSAKHIIENFHSELDDQLESKWNLGNNNN